MNTPVTTSLAQTPLPVSAAKPLLQARAARRLPQERRWSTPVIVLAQCALLIGGVLAWELSARQGWIDSFFWSQPSKIQEVLMVFFTQGDAWIDISFTFRATLAGFIIGTTLGTLIGLSFWWSGNYAAIVQPFIVCFESIPKLALAPLIILVFGIGLPSKIAIGVALTVVVSALTTFAGVKSVDRDLERLMYALGASRWQVFCKLVVPSVLPWGISVLRVNIGLALTGSIVGEFISSQHGLGRAILYAGQTYEIALVWVAVLVLSTLSILMYVAVAHIERVLMKHVKR